MKYAHTQRVPAPALAAAGGVGFVAARVIPHPLLKAVAVGGMAWAAATFNCLTVEVHEEYIQVMFGNTMVKKRLEMADVASSKQIRLNPLMGWGIHWVGNGWLYNVYGLDAVEVSLKNGSRFLIGTDEPTELNAVINSVLEARLP
ncbi:MAG: hypothetical protein ACRD3W_25960 [Terriglobales bacterium]